MDQCVHSQSSRSSSDESSCLTARSSSFFLDCGFLAAVLVEDALGWGLAAGTSSSELDSSSLVLSSSLSSVPELSDSDEVYISKQD